MAMLATLEGFEEKRGTFLGACEMVASTLRGCLGAIAGDAFAASGLNRSAAMQNIKATLDPIEFNIANDAEIYNRWVDGYRTIPQPGYIEFNDGSKTWDWVGRQLLSWGVDPSTYKVKKWFYPIQTFLIIWTDVFENYPTLNAEERAAIAYYNWLGEYFEPRDNVDKNIYWYKLNTLKSFIAGAGFPSAIKKVEAEQTRTAQAAQAAQSASAAAAAYKAAMERQEREEAKAKAEQEKIQNDIQEETQTPSNGGGQDTTAGSSLLPLAVAAAAIAALI